MSFWHTLAESFEHIVFPTHDDPAPDPVCTVTVRKGESLWAIAEKYTGHGSHYTDLISANPDKDWDQHYTIQPGEELKLPCSWLDDLAAKG